uniref:Uncharacterized protein n=1 Tax=Chrysemys picta bellii TaxID=8478 RepID=A0A8C3F412_CHRPI
KEGFCVLILIVIGHLSFFSGALMRGTVLCYVAKLQDAISLQYTISNIILVTSANLTISCAIAAIVLISSTLLLLFCSMELAVSIILTFANKGHALLATCTFANVELIQIPDKPPKVTIAAGIVCFMVRGWVESICFGNMSGCPQLSHSCLYYLIRK